MSSGKWIARPGVVLACILAAVVLTVLMVPNPTSGRGGNPRMTTRSADPLGTRLFYELAGKMGYDVSRADRWSIPADRNTILVVFDPAVPFQPAEVHEMLEHVRAGGALLAVLGARAATLADSLQLSVGRDGGAVLTPEEGGSCRTRTMGSLRGGLWLGTASLYALRVPDSLRASVRTFTSVLTRSSDTTTTFSYNPATIGFPYGRGRIVIASDPDAFANDALRNCMYHLDVAAVSALAYLRDNGAQPRTRIVFDEYHQKFRIGTTTMGLAWRYLTGTPSGNLLLQICIAGLVFLLAASTRILPPRGEETIERRSPLEHVDALARAYAQVGATRTGTQRLVRGLQRRLGGSRRAATRIDDELFLERIAASLPETQADVSVVRNALAHSVSPKDFAGVGRSVARIESALTRT